MAAHQLIIERAKFSAALLRPDVSLVSRDQISLFLDLVDKAVSRCTPANIQSCKTWILDNVTNSPARVEVLGKYFVAISKAHTESLGPPGDKDTRNPTTSSRRRLHLLYVLNDLLHHAKYHQSHALQFDVLSRSLRPSLLELVRLASSAEQRRVRLRTTTLLQIWGRAGYFDETYLRDLSNIVEDASTSFSQPADLLEISAAKTLEMKDQPYIMPSSHGDMSTPYHDLPAGNLMPHIIPNKPISIRPDSVRALSFAPGPAEENLVIAVKEFMAAVADIETGEIDDKASHGTLDDIDELGQHSHRDETGDLVAGRTYYGWSQEFCERMKDRRGRKSRPDRGRSSSVSSRSRSLSPRKRLRYESESDESMSADRSRSRHRTIYQNPPGGYRDLSSSRKGFTRSRSRSPSRPVFQPRTFESARNQFPPPSFMDHQQPPGNIQPPSVMPLPNMSFNPSQYGFMPPPIGPDGLPIPPPPSNQSGPWPPPPPMAANMAPNPTFGQMPSYGAPGFPSQGSQRGTGQYGQSASGWKR